MAQQRTDRAERRHILTDTEHYALLAAVFASIAAQGLLTEQVATLGGFQALKDRGLL